MNILESLISNWAVIVAAVAILAIVSFAVYTFIHYPNDEKMQKVREWLLYAVIEAERQFGTETGKIKLCYVYDLFISKFPIISCVISFNSFSNLVDNALVEFKKLLLQNENLQIKIYGEALSAEKINKLNGEVNGL